MVQYAVCRLTEVSVSMINPRHACAARVTVVGLSLCVCVFVIGEKEGG